MNFAIRTDLLVRLAEAPDAEVLELIKKGLHAIQCMRKIPAEKMAESAKYWILEYYDRDAGRDEYARLVSMGADDVIQKLFGHMGVMDAREIRRKPLLW